MWFNTLAAKEAVQIMTASTNSAPRRGGLIIRTRAAGYQLLPGSAKNIIMLTPLSAM